MSHDDPMSESNGNRRPIDPELISAFYDAETTAEERAAVEQCMDESGDTLQTLDEYDQLSQSLKQLHQLVRSPDLRAGVISQISSPTSSPAPSATSPSSRRTLQVVAGLTGLAAAVALLLWPSAIVPPENTLAVNEAVSTQQSAATGMAAAQQDFAEARADQAGASAPAEAPLTAQSTAAMEASIADSLADMTRDRPLPEVGEVLGYLDRNAEDLTWVAVTVVDIQKAGDQVQLLLAKNGVASADAPASSPAQPQSSDNLMTFLVEADWDQMEAVIVDLSDAAFVSSVKVDAPPDESVPQVLQGYSTTRQSDPALAQSNLSARMLKRRVQDRQAPPSPADSSPPGNSSKDNSEPQDAPQIASKKEGAVQMQLLVRGADLKRIAGQRIVDRRKVEAEPDASAADVADAQADNLTRPRELSKIGPPLARPRAKAVIVIQSQER